MKNPLGVMQGRLLPKYKGRYQAHPVGYWADEFPLASELGLDCIEFIVDFEEINKNPLFNSEGILELNKIKKQTRMDVLSICGDFLMEAPLHSKDHGLAKEGENILIDLIRIASKENIETIVIPCVDQSSIISEKEQNIFIEKLMPIAKIAEGCNVRLSLETDLDPKSFKKVLNKLNNQNIYVNYDIGNSASLGYNYIEELNTYGSRLFDIHIKDRALGGGSVLLGSGNADIKQFFIELKNYHYKGPIIMQAFRDDEGFSIFKRQLEWVKDFL